MENNNYKRHRFERKTAIRPYRVLFVIVVEGAKTEPIYFSIFNNENTNLRLVKCLQGQDGNSPPRILDRLEKFLNENRLLPNDQAWCVIDKDLWTDDQLNKIYKWSLTSLKYGLAVSNPKFEYWLLLHFEDSTKIKSSRDCSDRLKWHFPEYDKKFDKKIKNDMILLMIERAKKRDNPPCADWPRNPGCTTVYRLVERILNS